MWCSTGVKGPTKQAVPVSHAAGRCQLRSSILHRSHLGNVVTVLEEEKAGGKRVEHQR